MVQKSTALNAIYPPCVEPEACSSAVGWHWNTHTQLLNKNIVFFVCSRIVKTFLLQVKNTLFLFENFTIIYFWLHLYILRRSPADPTTPIVCLSKCHSVPPSIFVWFIPFQVFLIWCISALIDRSVALQPWRAKTDWRGWSQMAVQVALWLERLSLNLNFSFLNRILLLLISSSYPIVLTRLGGPHSRPYTSRKISRVEPGIKSGTSWMAVRRANHYTKQAVSYIVLNM